MKTMKSSVKCFVAMIIMAMAFCVTGITAQAATPTNLQQIGDSETSIKIQWSAVSGAKYYGIQVASDANFKSIVKTDYTSSLSDYVSSLTAGTAYYVRVGYGSKYNNCYTNFSTPIQVVTTPQKVTTVNFTTANDSSATINWSASVGATGYKITTYSKSVYTTTANSYAVPIKDSENGYSTTVCAYKTSTAGYTAISYNAYSPSLYKLTTKFSKNNFGVTNAYNNINVFYFGAVGNGNGYQIQGQTTSGKKYTFSGDHNGLRTSSTNEIRIATLKTKRMYKYRVRAYITNSAGQKVYGNWSDYRLICNQGTVKYKTSGKKIKLSWSKLTGASKIKIQISTKKNSGYKTVKTLSGSKKSYTITKCGKSKLKRGKTYYVRVMPQGKVSGKTLTSDVYIQGSIKVR